MVIVVVLGVVEMGIQMEHEAGQLHDRGIPVVLEREGVSIVDDEVEVLEL